MKKALIGFLILIIGITPGRSQDIDSVAFAKVVDNLNCKLVEYSINSNGQGAVETFKGKCNCDQSPGYDVITSAIPGNLKKTLELSKDINSIKRKFSPTWKLGDAILYLKDSAFSMSDALKKFNENHKNDATFASIKNNVENEISKYAKPHESHPENAQQNPATDANSATDANIVASPPSVFTLPVIILIVVVGIIIVILIFVGKALNSNRVPEHIAYYVESKISKAAQSSSGRSKQQTNSWESNSNGQNVRDLEQQIRLLEEKINKIQTELAARATLQTTKPTHSPANEIKNAEEIFYLSTPNMDGSFDNNDASQIYKEGASIYRFAKLSSTRAQFFIEDKDDSIQRALQYPDKRIDPVCEAQNAFNPRAKSIKTITPGEVELVGDKWVISFNRKAKIRYE